MERIGPYILLKTIGTGVTSKVKLAEHSETKEKAAIKIIDKAKLTSNASLKRKVEREIAVMKLISHPHVIRLYDVLQTKKYLFLVVEYVEGGELFQYIVKKGKLNEEEAFRFFSQIISGIEYCHNRLICHRDLKPENLLLDENLNIKIADFGMANLMSNDHFVETSCGSPHYASPEVIQGGKYNGMKADLWSCGVILYALLAGTLPFDDANLTLLLSKVKSGKFQFPDEFPEDCQDLVLKLLEVSPEKRYTISQLKRHSWWKKMEDHRKEKEQATEISMENMGTYTEDDSESMNDLDFEIKKEDISEDIFSIMVQMGWKDKKQLESKLTEPTKNIETVMYNILKGRKTDFSEFEIKDSSLQNVGPNNPLTDIVEPLKIMEKKIKEAEKLQKEQEKSKRKSNLFTFLRGKPKKENLENLAQFEIFTTKSEKEIFRTLNEIFKELKIAFSQLNPTTLRATCSTNPVQFNIKLFKKDDGFKIVFVHAEGNAFTCDAIFDVLKDSLDSLREHPQNKTD